MLHVHVHTCMLGTLQNLIGGPNGFEVGIKCRMKVDQMDKLSVALQKQF